MTTLEFRAALELDQGACLKMARLNQARALEATKRSYRVKLQTQRYSEITYQSGDLALVQFAAHISHERGGPVCDGPVRVIAAEGRHGFRCFHLGQGTEKLYSVGQMIPFLTNAYEPTPETVAARSRLMWMVEAVVGHRYDDDDDLLVLVIGRLRLTRGSL
jgi:hypothetical protein